MGYLGITGALSPFRPSLQSALQSLTFLPVVRAIFGLLRLDFPLCFERALLCVLLQSVTTIG